MRLFRTLSLMVMAIAGLSSCNEALADTNIAAARAVFGAGPNAFYGRKDGVGFDAATKAPMLFVDGSVDQAFVSSLYLSSRQEFLGDTVIHDVDSDDGDQGVWAQQATNTAIGAWVDDGADGLWRLTTDNGNEVGDATLYWGNQQNIPSTQGFVGVFRIKPTLNAATDTVACGFYGAYNALVDSTTYNAYFSIAGADLGLDLNSDDNVTDVGPTDTGVTLTAGTLYEVMICANAVCGGSATAIKFFYRSTLGDDWTALKASTTFSMGATSRAIQPFCHVQKTSSTATPVLDIDYINVFWKRT